MKKGLLTVFCGLFALSGGLFGADISVPYFELSSRGARNDGDFEMRSSLETGITVSGGYKYGVSLGLGAEIPNLEKALSNSRFEVDPLWSQEKINGTISERLNNQAVLSIRFITATMREVLNTPLDISFFVGNYDKLGSGDEFQENFGTDPLGTGIRGFFYYPEGFNNDPFFRFNGAIHSIKGTGLAFKAGLGNFVPALYVYHDLSFPPETPDTEDGYAPGHYSADLKLLANGEKAKFEVFFGFTYASDDDDAAGNDAEKMLRGGAMAWFGADPFSLLIQAGITYYELESSLEIDNCYFLLEPRFRLGKFGANLTFFCHPVYYLNRTILDESGTDKARGRADINLRLFFGGLGAAAFEAGLEGTANLKLDDGEEAVFWVSPFVSVVTSGLRWDLALRFNPQYAWDERELLEGFAGIRASY